jgi:hypothetical protein
VEKRCGKCKKTKPVCEFYRSTTQSGGYYGYCKLCFLAYQKGRKRKLSKETLRRYQLKKYGLTAAEFDAMLEKQEGKCAVCAVPLDEPHIDHCHETGLVRGLLCVTCNVGLGMFKDSFVLVENAANYLHRNLVEVA